MKLVMFSVYDNKARAYCTPFFCPTEEVGMRAFATAANDPAHLICHHPEDYTLVVIATFDDDTGAVAVKPHILQLGMAISFQRPSARVDLSDPKYNEVIRPLSSSFADIKEKQNVR